VERQVEVVSEQGAHLIVEGRPSGKGDGDGCFCIIGAALAKGDLVGHG
jgi:hypothetical protein